MKFTYTSDSQIIAEAAQELIAAHLDWSGSTEGMPSRDLSNVRGKFWEAYLEANYTPEEWNELNQFEQAFEEENASALFKKAKREADRKWEAAKVLLGL